MNLIRGGLGPIWAVSAIGWMVGWMDSGIYLEGKTQSAYPVTR
jgi:hypothetical protein